MILRRTRSFLGACLLVTSEIAGVALLTRLGSVEGVTVDWRHLPEWLAATPSDDALVAVARVIGLGLTWWLLGSTLLYMVARVLRLPGLVRGFSWATPRSIRRLIDGLLAGSLVVGTTFGAGAAQAATQTSVPPPVYVPRPAGDGPVGTPAQASATTTSTTATDVVMKVAPEAQTQPPKKNGLEGESTAASTYVVRPGDSLWRIAQRQVGGTSDGDIPGYWRRLVAVNRHRLASGNPDLIYPGEELVLPPPEHP